MKTIAVITHRGLDYDIPGFPGESSVEAFTLHLERGYGLEFDVRFTADGQMVVIHDGDLVRLTGGQDQRKVAEMTLEEFLAVDRNGSHFTTFRNLLELIKTKQHHGAISALHIKSGMQTEPQMTAIMEALVESGIDPEKLIIFDLRIDSGKFIKSRWPQFQLSASVSHPYDVERFNKPVGFTLLTLEEIIANKAIFSWAWGDEWDRRDGKGGDKTLYNAEVFGKLREHGIKIALVTTELHYTTPGQLGGGDHEDGAEPRLTARNKEIIALRPDAMCTDHPDKVRALAEVA
jgi:hypothetical protein